MYFLKLILALLGGLTALALQAATVQVTVLDREGRPLADAVVLIEVAGVRPAPPVQAIIAQHKMQFQPALTVVPPGSRLRFSNLDGWEHHVRGMPAGLAGLSAGADSGFELRLPGRKPEQEPASAELQLRQTGPLQLGCHLHGSMRGFIYVSETPWAGKTDAAGQLLLQNVPEGQAQLRVWHGDQLLELPPSELSVVPLTVTTVRTTVVPRRRRL